MDVTFTITRQPGGVTQRIPFHTDDENATVATALLAMNAHGAVDQAGQPVSPIQWECSCLQKKCGACAMRINGTPRLACDAKLSELGGEITLEPLRKFPVIADLTVDRQSMFDALKSAEAWLKSEALQTEKTLKTAYDASRCLQCGLCLEVCPNFLPGERYLGPASLPPLARLLAQSQHGAAKEAAKAYRQRYFAGCGGSMACKNICPAGIDVEALQVRSNAAALWRTWR